MNEVNVLLADRQDFKFVTAVFAPYTGTKTYTYKTFLDVAEDDFAVVDTPTNGYQVVHIREVLSPLDVNLDVNFEYRWLVSILDTEAYTKAVELEKALRREVNTSKNRRALAQAKADILNGLDTDAVERTVKLVRL